VYKKGFEEDDGTLSMGKDLREIILDLMVGVKLNKEK
jgi:hypothetical protein